MNNLGNNRPGNKYIGNYNSNSLQIVLSSLAPEGWLYHRLIT